ncbi:hypothetical protein VIGAN_09095700 [Vigna angularis var. angularis]|uniref:Uncharacterized protein n=1 Tax=Vigna angularis var. angularis TaxID=157739 RepID=A0A0S3SXI6_PHAAN|nr:hypothetical protein VIGAN_09095700 [Vigna angularis var. angularis]
MRLEMNKLSGDVSSFVNCISLSLIFSTQCSFPSVCSFGFIENTGLCGYWLDSSCQGSHPTERDAPVVHEETRSSEVNLFSRTRLIDSSQTSTKQVKPSCQLHKILKFKLSPDSEIHNIITDEEVK